MEYDLGYMPGVSGHVLRRQGRTPGMAYQNHLLGADCFAYRFDVLHGAPERVVAYVRQKARQTTSSLIEEKNPKALLREAAINRLVKGSLAQARTAVKKDDGSGVDGHARRWVELAVSDSGTSGQLPVAGIFKWRWIGREGRRLQNEPIQRDAKDQRQNAGQQRCQPGAGRSTPKACATMRGRPQNNKKRRYGQER